MNLKSLLRDYRKLKLLTISIGVVFLPLGTYVGFSFGMGRYREAFVGLGIQVALTVADTWIYWEMMECLPKGD